MCEVLAIWCEDEEETLSDGAKWGILSCCLDFFFFSRESTGLYTVEDGDEAILIDRMMETKLIHILCEISMMVGCVHSLWDGRDGDETETKRYAKTNRDGDRD